MYNPSLLHINTHISHSPFPKRKTKKTNMDPTLKNFPILSYVMEKLPSFKRTSSNTTADHDIENQPSTPPTPSHPHFELYEKMPHLKNPNLLSSMRHAVSDVSKNRSVLKSLGARPDHEMLDTARSRVAEIEAREIKDSDESEDYRVYKAAIDLEEMHASYEKMLEDAERRLERIYAAAVSGEVVEETSEVAMEKEEVNEDVVKFLKEVENGKVVERVELCGKGVRSFPEALGKLKFVVVMNLSNNRLQVIPDSIAGLENLEELNLSSNVLELFPDSVCLLFKLKILDVSKNKLTALPDSICHCRSLVELDASFNKLTYLPTNIGYELVNLQKLSIQLNKIRSLPTSIGEMKSLRLLDVHFNELHGLPHSIGKLKNLETLNLGSNFSDLTELPKSFADLTNLKELDLSNNQIHALPDAFGRLVNLTKLNVAENPLEIPPKEIVSEGVEAVRAFMDKRQEEIHTEKQSNNMVETNDGSDASLLTRSTSWLSNVVTNVSGTVSGYISPRKSNADDYMNQKF